MAHDEVDRSRNAAMRDPEEVSDTVVLIERMTGLTAVFGVVIMASTIIVTIPDIIGLHNVIVGAAIAIIASAYVYRIADTYTTTIAFSIVLGLLGIWVVVSPFVFGISRNLVIGINVLFGGLIALLAVAGVYLSFRR